MTRPKGWRKPVDLTTDEYMKMKKNGMKDDQIALLCDVHTQTMRRWKKEHGLEGVQLKSQEVVRPFTSRGERRLKELIRRVKELRKSYWSNEAIAKELDVSMYSIQEIITMYLPEEKRKAPRVYTAEQKARAKKSGVDMKTVGARIAKGWDIDEALDKPLLREGFFTKEQKKILKNSGVNRGTVMSRMKKGMTFKEALETPLFKINKKGRKVKNENK